MMAFTLGFGDSTNVRGLLAIPTKTPKLGDQEHGLLGTAQLDPNLGIGLVRGLNPCSNCIVVNLSQLSNRFLQFYFFHALLLMRLESNNALLKGSDIHFVPPRATSDAESRLRERGFVHQREITMS
jgi:hypothetical protein